MSVVISPDVISSVVILLSNIQIVIVSILNPADRDPISAPPIDRVHRPIISAIQLLVLLINPELIYFNLYIITSLGVWCDFDRTLKKRTVHGTAEDDVCFGRNCIQIIIILISAPFPTAPPQVVTFLMEVLLAPRMPNYRGSSHAMLNTY